MEEYISASRAGAIIGLSRSRAAKIAQEAYRNKTKDDKWPEKYGRGYLAPLEYWEKLFKESSVKVRKKRKDVDTTKESQGETKLITATQAAEKIGISPAWAGELARRSALKKREWPKKSGGMWLAPLDEWEKITTTLEVKSWNKKK